MLPFQIRVNHLNDHPRGKYQPKWVPDEPGIDGFYVGAIKIGVLHMIQQSIAPVESVRLKING